MNLKLLYKTVYQRKNNERGTLQKQRNQLEGAHAGQIQDNLSTKIPSGEKKKGIHESILIIYRYSRKS